MHIISWRIFALFRTRRWNSCYSYFDVLEGQIKWSLPTMIMTDEPHLMVILNTLEKYPNSCKQRQNYGSVKGTVSTHKHVQLVRCFFFFLNVSMLTPAWHKGKTAGIVILNFWLFILAVPLKNSGPWGISLISVKCRVHKYKTGTCLIVSFLSRF